LGLSEEEKGQIWDRLAADVPHSEELRIIEVKTRV
jgi:lipase chaperone LimK